MTHYADVITLPNIYGQSKMDDYLGGLATKIDNVSQMQFAFIDEAITVLEMTDPNVLSKLKANKVISATLSILIEDKKYTKNFKLIKKMVGHDEVFEIRLDYKWQDLSIEWFLRIFFFQYTYQKRQYYCLTDYLEKNSTDLKDHNKQRLDTNRTNFLAGQAAGLRKQITSNPARYAVHFK